MDFWLSMACNHLQNLKQAEQVRILHVEEESSRVHENGVWRASRALFADTNQLQ